MATTAYLAIEDQITGTNNNTWGDVLDANDQILEAAIARVTEIATTGGGTVLTANQNRRPIIVVTGALVSNATITVALTAEKTGSSIIRRPAQDLPFASRQAEAHRSISSAGGRRRSIATEPISCICDLRARRMRTAPELPPPSLPLTSPRPSPPILKSAIVGT